MKTCISYSPTFIETAQQSCTSHEMTEIVDFTPTIKLNIKVIILSLNCIATKLHVNESQFWLVLCVAMALSNLYHNK